MTDTVRFSTVNNPTSWDTQDHGSIEFANHAEAKKAEALFNSMLQKLASYQQAMPEMPLGMMTTLTVYRPNTQVLEYINAISMAYAALKVERDELQAKLAACEKDAARYRWLRNNGGAQYAESASLPTGTRPCIYTRVPSMNESGSFILLGGFADSAIDAALKENT